MLNEQNILTFQIYAQPDALKHTNVNFLANEL